MSQTAMLFKDGNSQAVRLPAEFQFAGTEVAIRRDLSTGEVVLSPTVAQSGSWQEFFDLVDTLGVPEDFMANRELQLPVDREIE